MPIADLKTIVIRSQQTINNRISTKTLVPFRILWWEVDQANPSRQSKDSTSYQW